MTTNGGSDPTPQPKPHPKPHPGPKPGAAIRPGATSQQIAAPAPNDPRRFGRVDADGTVWLLGPGGERRIGTWQAGDTDAAFEHFGRRFDDLSTEVALLEKRLASGTGDARKIKITADSLAESLPTASVLGDVDALATRLSAIRERAESVAAETQARRAEHRAEARSRKEALVAEAEELAATSTQWKVAGDRMRAIVEEWRTVTGLDRKTDDVLWKRYSAARDSFNRRRGSHFAELDRERAGARQDKERLCKRAEELSSSTDWKTTSAAFHDLLAEWKQIPRASRDVDDALWRRFKAAQDVFFGARGAADAERDAEQDANAAAKEALLVEAERLDPQKRDAARAALRTITAKWDAIGRVPRDRMAELERRLKAVEQKVRDAGETSRTDPEAEARAAQFRTRADQYEQRAEKARAAGRAKEAAEAAANAEQWRQWASAAEQALSRER